MTKTLTDALAAVRDWHANHPDGGHPDLHMGDPVVELGGDGSILYIAAFESTRRGEYIARCIKLGTDEVLVLPVNALKLAHTHTLH